MEMNMSDGLRVIDFTDSREGTEVLVQLQSVFKRAGKYAECPVHGVLVIRREDTSSFQEEVAKLPAEDQERVDIRD